MKNVEVFLTQKSAADKPLAKFRTAFTSEQDWVDNDLVCLEDDFEYQTVEGFEKVTNPKFEVYTDKAGETRFRLKARNGEIIATGESYKAKASCLNGIDSIKRNADSEVVKEY